MDTGGVIFRIKKFAIHDGPGIRTTIFLKGCPLSCSWCHNPEGINPRPEMIGTSCATGHPETVGKTVTVGEVVSEIEKDTVFYDESGGGVTFSGGEPLFQGDFLYSLAKVCAERRIHTVLDTSGFASKKTFERIVDIVDRVHFDLKIMDESDHVRHTGVSNRPILENLASLAVSKRKPVIRFPIIPGITDGDTNIRMMAEYLATLGNLRRIDLLPFHRTAESKYVRMGKSWRMNGANPPDKSCVNEIRSIFEAHGFDVKTGG